MSSVGAGSGGSGGTGGIVGLGCNSTCGCTTCSIGFSVVTSSIFFSNSITFWSNGFKGTSCWEFASFQPVAPAAKILASAAKTETVLEKLIVNFRTR